MSRAAAVVAHVDGRSTFVDPELYFDPGRSPRVAPGVGDRFLRDPEQRGGHRLRHRVDIALEPNRDGWACGIRSRKRHQCTQSRGRCAVRRVPGPQDADHRAHFAEGAGGFVLDRPQHFGRGIRVLRGDRCSRLGLNRDGRDVVGDRVVQVAGQLLTLHQPSVIELPGSRPGAPADGEPQGTRRHRDRDAADDVGAGGGRRHKGDQHPARDEAAGDDHPASRAPPEHGVEQEQEVDGRVQLRIASGRETDACCDHEGCREHRQGPSPPPQDSYGEPGEHDRPQPAPRHFGTHGCLDRHQHRDRADEHPVPPDPLRRRRRSCRRIPERTDPARHALMIGGHWLRRIGRGYDVPCRRGAGSRLRRQSG